ncbi:MAG TPA: DUF2235 domain-containing protein [Thermodesulfobacteriaceae bacterium]|nr:DUF2235 domain-containing protein [Thermodesulfobacteriaceae bacterium]
MFLLRLFCGYLAGSIRNYRRYKVTKNIILLSDGTGNGAAKRNKTNVYRLYKCLDLHREDQVAFYDDGVGAQEFVPLKLIGGIFGYGLKRNVLELYKFLCRNYRKNDRIYLFGFSRGAFTVRLLAGMIARCGVYTRFADERDLDRAARQNYNAFRSSFKRGLLTKGIRRLSGRWEPVESCCMPDIEFIGVWDTVDAYGFPIDEMAAVWDILVYPMHFPDLKLSKKVKKACHALSVDDERHTFQPLLWDESDEADGDRIEQVWFPGVHSDVGGGYPRNSLSLVSLDWMLTRAEAQDGRPGKPGLHLIQRRRQDIVRHSDWHGSHHDSRAMAGAYYRYKPRDIESLCDDFLNGVHIEKPKIHRSVFERIKGNVYPYAPTVLPEQYQVVSTRGSAPVYETAAQARERKKEMGRVKWVIRQRTMLYYSLLLTTFAYIVSPFAAGCFRNGGCRPVDGLLDPVLKLITDCLPEMVSPWLEVLRAHPTFFYILAALLVFLLFSKKRAWEETCYLASRAWKHLKKKY